MPPALVSLAVADRVAILSMERPPVNAISQALMSELGAGLDQAAADPGIRVIIITSALPAEPSASRASWERRARSSCCCWASRFRLTQRWGSAS